MPKIELKPNSPEFVDDEDKTIPRDKHCDMPGCDAEGDYKAPKDRDLGEYHYFCFEHVQEYNKAWNYFTGMSDSQIEDYIIRSTLWDRPTWRYDNFANLENHLRSKAWQYYKKNESRQEKEQDEKRRHEIFNKNTPEFEAMAIMGLEPPLDLAVIKTRYKSLVKKYHPDINPNDPEAENLLKSINMAYTILKMAYEKYEKIVEKDNKD